MAKGPWELTKSLGLPGGEIIKSIEAGIGIGRSVSSWGYRRRLESEGYDPMTVEAAVEAMKAGRDPRAILQRAKQAYQLRERQDALRTNPPPIHGSARWATVADVERARLSDNADGRSVALGTLDGQPVSWDGESHLLTVAPTRTGKSNLQIIPTLLTYQGSAVVLDPKGELYQHTAKWREANVGPVHVLNPFGIPGIPSSAFNPLDAVTDGQSALELADIVHPGTGDDKQAFFDHEAVAFLTAAIEFTARFAPASHRNLGTVRDALATLGDDLKGLVKAMAHPRLPPSIRNAALNFSTKTHWQGQQRVLDTLNTHLRMWDTEGLRRATSRTDFDFQSLKDRPQTVYLVLPFKLIETYSTFVKLVFATALNAMLANARVPDIPVLFVLDEFLMLDRDDRFVSALRTHASAGTRLWFFLQDLPTLEQKYPTTWKTFFQAEVKTFFGTDDPHTAELVSRYLGDMTIAYETPNMSASTSGGQSTSSSFSISENLHLASRKLLTPDEVITFMHGDVRGRKAIHFARNVPPVPAELAPWFSNDSLRERV